MNKEIEENLVVIFTGDETNSRKKADGTTLIDQLFLSIKSIRKNWSTGVEIVFIHTQPLSAATLCQLSDLKVTNVNAARKVDASFPIANKMLVGEGYRGDKDILFLDCDTIVHQPLDFDVSQAAIVAFDALQDVSEDTYRKLYTVLGVEFPIGDFSDRPSYDYYVHERRDMFPLINTGVYFLKNNLKDSFYTALQDNFHKTYETFRGELDFYFDQICFALTLHQLGVEYTYFPKGYNFICTPRAPYLKEWPRNQIFIEHYAGDNSSPLVFSGNNIDVEKSGILIM
ncbi:hypothetical protein [Roseibium sp. M-1]